MKNVILFILLVIVSGGARADWFEFGHNENFTGYIDSASLRRAGNLVRVSSMIDYKMANTNAGEKYASVKAQHEFDCGEGQVRKLFTSLHSGNMGKGEIVSYSYKIENYEPIQPFSILEAIWKIACE